MWGDKFLLTPSQIELINEQLRWVISFPLAVTFEGEKHTVGVLNVDGLEEFLSEGEMGIIYENLKTGVDTFAEKLGHLDKRRIVIMVEDVEAVSGA